MPPNSHAHHQFPPVVIQRAVWLPQGRGPAGRTQPGGVLGDDPALGAGVGSGGPAAPAETEPALARRRNGGAHRRQADAPVAGGGRRRRDAGRPGAAPAEQGRHPQAPREARLGVPLQRLPRVPEGRGRQQVSAPPQEHEQHHQQRPLASGPARGCPGLRALLAVVVGVVAVATLHFVGEVRITSGSDRAPLHSAFQQPFQRRATPRGRAPLLC